MYCLEGMKSVIWYILISVHFVLKNEFQKEVIKKINDKKNPQTCNCTLQQYKVTM